MLALRRILVRIAMIPTTDQQDDDIPTLTQSTLAFADLGILEANLRAAVEAIERGRH